MAGQCATGLTRVKPSGAGRAIIVEPGDDISNVIIVEIGEEHGVGGAEIARVGEFEHWLLERSVPVAKQGVGGCAGGAAAGVGSHREIQVIVF